jgi:rhamnosyltransferase subunit A
MRPETAVIEVEGTYRIHTERFANPQARETVLLVNGSLATTASFAQTVRYLQPCFNVVLYDQPYAGRSRGLNPSRGPISRDTEASILLALIAHFAPSRVLSFSWGGVTALMALAQRPPGVERAAILSFSPRINPAMRDYLENGLDHLRACDRSRIGALINDTLGKHLPSLFKRYNHRHLSNLADTEYAQMLFHIEQALALDAMNHDGCVANIRIPLQFINGQLDEHTTASDARLFAEQAADCQFQVIERAGHFLDLEHKSAWADTRGALLGFLARDSAPSERLAAG